MEEMTKIRLGDDEGIRYQGKNYIPQVVAREDLQTIYDALRQCLPVYSFKAEAEIACIKEKWGLE